MVKGFLAFALGAVFLIALVSSALLLGAGKPDLSFRAYQAAHVQDVAVKRAFFSSVSQAASAAYAASGNSPDPGAAVQLAVRGAAVDFAAQLRSEGYDAIFWCGSPSVIARQQASAAMQAASAALLPSGATELSHSSCIGSFYVYPKTRKVAFQNLGFSVYFPNLGLGFASAIPSDFEVFF